MKRRFIVPAIVCALVMSMGMSSTAGAATIADLQAQIASLLAQLQALQGTSAVTAPATPAVTTPTFDQDIVYGTTNDSDVTALQRILITEGYLSADSATGNFFDGTLAAVKAFQSAHGINPTGYVGASTRAALSSIVTSTADTNSNANVNVNADNTGPELAIPQTDDSVPCTITYFSAPSTVQTLTSTLISYNTVGCNTALYLTGGDFNGPHVLSAPSGSIAVLVRSTAAYTLTGSGSIGSQTSRRITITAGDVNNTDNASNPSVTLSASPTSIVAGQPTTITYTSTNASSCFGSAVKGRSFSGTNGSFTDSPTQTTDYSITCYDSRGHNAYDQLTVYVTPAEVSSAPTVSLRASQSSVTAGQSVTLTWSSENSTSCTGNLPLKGFGGLNGQTSDNPVKSTTYTLTCTGPGGSESASAFVAVSAQSSGPSINSFEANPDSVQPGYSSMLSWSVSEATSCNLSGIGPVSFFSNGTRINLFSSDQIYTLTCTDSQGRQAQKSVTVKVNKPAVDVVPTVHLTASPSSITAGQTTTLTWSSTNATSCSGNPTAMNGTSGSISVTPTSSTWYTVTCNGTNGSANAKAFVGVSTVSEGPTIQYFNSNVSTVNSGQQATLSWSVTDATACSITGVGTVGFSGTHPVYPTTSFGTYNLVCTDFNGRQANKTVTVTVNTPQITVAPTVTLKAASSSITAGQTTTLTWSSTNATSCSGTSGMSGTNGSISVTPTTSTTYTVTCTGLGGSKSASAFIGVSTRSSGPTVHLSANPTAVDQGNASTLSWSATDASSCSITGVGTVGFSGTRTVYPTTSFGTYNLVCTDFYGQQANQSVTVTVNAPKIIPPPTVTLAASRSSITAGETATLTWSSTGATSCSSAQAAMNSTSGSVSVNPTTSQTYVITCYGLGGSISASAAVNVNTDLSSPSILSFRSNVGSTSVSPYTSVTLSWGAADATRCSITPQASTNLSSSGSYPVTPSTTTTYSLTCYNANGVATAPSLATVNVLTPNPAPTVTLNASQLSIIAGQTATLTWSSTNATSCSGTSGMSGTNGSISVSPTTSTTYTVTCTGLGGSKSANVMINVSTPVSTPSILSFRSSVGSTSVAPNSSVSLSWSSADATRCSITPQASTNLSSSGTYPVNPSTSTAYTLTCYNSAGVASSPASVTVNVSAVPTATLRANLASITAGQTVTLTWSSTNATSCSGTSGMSGTSGSISVTPTSSTWYTVTCNGAGGSASAKAFVGVSTVSEGPTIQYFSSDVSSVSSGKPATLSWSVTDSSSCDITGIGGVGSFGTKQVYPTTSFGVYKLTCTDFYGQQASQSVTVTVNVPAAPIVSLTPAASSINFGDSATLSWTSTNAVSCDLSSLGRSDTSTSGSVPVTPTVSQSYSVTCRNSAGVSASAGASVTVIPPTQTCTNKLCTETPSNVYAAMQQLLLEIQQKLKSL